MPIILSVHSGWPQPTQQSMRPLVIVRAVRANAAEDGPPSPVTAPIEPSVPTTHHVENSTDITPQQPLPR